MSKIITMFSRPINKETFQLFLLLTATLSALLIANSSYHSIYSNALHREISLSTASVSFSTTPFYIINNILMTGFFILMSIHIKKEILIGDFGRQRFVLLPSVAALGGVVVPALFYWLCNWSYPHFKAGWAIPTATDIVFSLGALSLLGHRVPSAAKLFLMTLAIVDDLCAVLIISILHIANLSALGLCIGVLCIVGLYFLNQRQIMHFWPYALIGLLLWFGLYQAGVHPTSAGVIWAAFLPVNNVNSSVKNSLLETVEYYLMPWVHYFILPVFALVNAGIPMNSLTQNDMIHPVFLGIFLGLVLGKPIGILLGSGLAQWITKTHLPNHISWQHLIGLSCLSGIGFTMSFLIGDTVFSVPPLSHLMRQAVLIGSLVSILLGLIIFPKTNPCLVAQCK